MLALVTCFSPNQSLDRAGGGAGDPLLGLAGSDHVVICRGMRSVPPKSHEPRGWGWFLNGKSGTLTQAKITPRADGGGQGRGSSWRMLGRCFSDERDTAWDSEEAAGEGVIKSLF